MNIGDLVNKPSSPTFLCCGSGIYPHAVVMSIDPLILVSEETDMRWTKIDKRELSVVGKAKFFTVIYCLRRLSFSERVKFFKNYRKVKL